MSRLPPKKWKVTVHPSFTDYAATSKADAYREVNRTAERVHDDNASGRFALRVQSLTVFVDERDGRGWQTYERFSRDELVALHAGHARLAAAISAQREAAVTGDDAAAIKGATSADKGDKEGPKQQ